MTKRIDDIEKALESVILSLGENNQSGNIEAASLEILGQTLGCEWGTYWKVDGHRLTPSSIWNPTGNRATKLYDDTTKRSLTLSEGNAGHVWRSRTPIWSVNISKDMCLPRSLDAQAIGLRGGIWFAIQTDKVVYGVVELLGQNVSPASKELLLAIERLGFKIGLIIERGLKNQKGSRF